MYNVGFIYVASWDANSMLAVESRKFQLASSRDPLKALAGTVFELSRRSPLPKIP